MIHRVYEQIESAYAARGKIEMFEGLKGYLEWNSGETGYAEIAMKLGMTENALQQAVYRLRGQFRRVLEEEVAETVDSQAHLHREIDCLIQALS